jgi:hypothetical protein
VTDVFHKVPELILLPILSRKTHQLDDALSHKLLVSCSFLMTLLIMKFSVCVAAATFASSAVAFIPSQSKTAASIPFRAVKVDGDITIQKPTGTSFLPKETVERAQVGNPTEKVKLAKDPINAWVDVYEYARKIRDGEMTWEEVEVADLDTVREVDRRPEGRTDIKSRYLFSFDLLKRLKYVGMLHRGKRTPGQFMMRLKVPNGIINSDQMRFYADSVEKYGEGGVVDITTRQNIQLRGVKIEDAPDIIDGLHARNQTTFQSALDSVRNVVGSPLAGIDDQELVDTRMISNAINDLISLDPITETRGNPMWANCKFSPMSAWLAESKVQPLWSHLSMSIVQYPVNSTLPSVAHVMITHIRISTTLDYNPLPMLRLESWVSTSSWEDTCRSNASPNPSTLVCGSLPTENLSSLFVRQSCACSGTRVSARIVKRLD